MGVPPETMEEVARFGDELTGDFKEKTYTLYDLEKIQGQPIDWLWYPYIPFGMITIIQGDPGCGKTMLVLSMIARLSKGLPLYDQDSPSPPMICIYQTAEDSLECTIKPRLEAADADCTRIKMIDESEQQLTFCDERLESVIRDTGAKLLVLDPLQAYLGSDVDMHRANEVRPVFRHLSDLAARTGCAIVLVGHMNKMKELNSIYRGLGSIDIAGSARSIMLVAKPQPNEPEIYFSHVKSNVGPKGNTLVFTIEDNHIVYHGATDVSADQALEGAKGDMIEQSTKVQKVISTLEDYFRGMTEISAKDALRYFSEQGISERTVAVARREMGLHAYKRGNAWYWSKREPPAGTSENTVIKESRRFRPRSPMKEEGSNMECEACRVHFDS